MQELWKPVLDYDGLYEVSNLGRVRSIRRYVNTARGKRFKSEHYLAPSLNKKTGYYSVCLAKDGGKRSVLLHYLVASAFIGNRPDGCQVNHKNEDKSDNRAENLEWVSAKENTNYGTANARRAGKLSVSKCKQVAQILNGKIISVFPSTISAKHIADPGHISACALGKRASAGGYVWQYI